VPITSQQRAWAAVALIFATVMALGVIYYRHLRKPLPVPTPGPAPDLIGQLPAKAPLIAFLDAAALRSRKDSSLIVALMAPSSGTEADADYKAFVKDTGFDYARDLDRAAVAVWPRNLAPTQQTVAQDRTLAIADGRFDQEKIEAYALDRHGRQQTRGSEHYYVVPGAPPVAFKFLSPSRILISSGPDPGELLHISNSGPRDAAAEDRISRVAGAPFFAVARTDTLPDSFYAPLRNSPQLAQLARSVQGVTLAGNPQGELLVVTLDAECSSMKDSLELSALVDGFRLVGSMALSDPKARGQMSREQASFLSDVIHRTRVTHQDKWVRLTLEITPEMLGSPAAAADPGAPAKH
jgi:hypothetical protein